MNKEKIESGVEQVPDVFVQWTGETVLVWDSRAMKKLLSSFSAREFTCQKLMLWCQNRGFRCSQIRGGKVVL